MNRHDQPLAYRHALLVVLIGLWAAAVVLSHTPQDRIGHLDRELGISYESMHLVGFLGLSGSFWLTLRAFGVGRWRRVACLLAIMTAYAALDELTQPWFGRSCEMEDFVTDVVATVAALAVGELVLFLSARRAAARAG